MTTTKKTLPASIKTRQDLIGAGIDPHTGYDAFDNLHYDISIVFAPCPVDLTDDERCQREDDETEAEDAQELSYYETLISSEPGMTRCERCESLVEDSEIRGGTCEECHDDEAQEALDFSAMFANGYDHAEAYA